MVAPLRPLSTPEILDGAFTLLRRNLGLLLAITAIFMALIAPLLLVLPLWAVGLVAGGVFLVRDGALLYVAAELAQGRSVRLGQALRQGLYLFLPLLAGTILFTLAWMPMMLVMVGIVAAAVSIVGNAGGILVLGFLPLAAYIYASWFAWQQLVVVEREFNFVKHSTRLAKNARWKILVVSFVSYLLVGLPQFVILGARVASSGWDWSTAIDTEATSTGTLLAQWLVGGLTMPYWILAVTLLYFDRRVRIDGFDVQQTVAEFERATGAD